MTDPSTARGKALLAAVVTAGAWGLTGIFVRLLPPLSPVAITAGRLLVALAVAAPLIGLFPSMRQCLLGASRLPVAYVLAGALAVYYLLATAAFQMAPVAEVALLVSMPPLFVLAFRYVAGDKPTLREATGAVVAVGGVALILLPRLALNEPLATTRLAGDLLAICAAAATAFYAYAYGRLAERQRAPEPMGVALLTFMLGASLLAALAFVLPAPESAGMDRKAILMLLGLGVVSTAIPSLAFAIASRFLPSVLTAAILLLIPLFAGIFAFFVLGEKVSSTTLPGGILILAGIGLILGGSARIAGAGAISHARHR